AEVARDTTDGGDANEAALLAHQVFSQQLLVDALHRYQADFHQQVPEVFRHARQGLVPGDTCVMDHHVNTTGFLAQEVGDLLRTGVLRGGHQHRDGADRLGDRLEALAVTWHAQGDHLGAVTGQDARNGGTSPAGSARHQGCLSTQRSISVDAAVWFGSFVTG